MILEAKLALGAAAIFFATRKKPAAASTPGGTVQASPPARGTADAPNRYVGGGTVSNRLESGIGGSDRQTGPTAGIQGGAALGGLLGGLTRGGGALIDRAIMATPAGRALGLFGYTPSSMMRAAAADPTMPPSPPTNSQSSAFADEIAAEQAAYADALAGTYSDPTPDITGNDGYGVNDYGASPGAGEYGSDTSLSGQG